MTSYVSRVIRALSLLITSKQERLQRLQTKVYRRKLCTAVKNFTEWRMKNLGVYLRQSPEGMGYLKEFIRTLMVYAKQAKIPKEEFQKTIARLMKMIDDEPPKPPSIMPVGRAKALARPAFLFSLFSRSCKCLTTTLRGGRGQRELRGYWADR
jgi:hypothetical protein